MIGYLVYAMYGIYNYIIYSSVIRNLDDLLYLSYYIVIITWNMEELLIMASVISLLFLLR